MVDNSNMPHPKCLGSQKNPGTEPKTCEKEPKLGFEYLPTSKTLHCVRTACMAFPLCRSVQQEALGRNALCDGGRGWSAGNHGSTSNTYIMSGPHRGAQTLPCAFPVH